MADDDLHDKRRGQRILERAAQEAAALGQETEPFPDWFVRMTRPGIDLDPAIDENRTPHAGPELPGRRSAARPHVL